MAVDIRSVVNILQNDHSTLQEYAKAALMVAQLASVDPQARESLAQLGAVEALCRALKIEDSAFDQVKQAASLALATLALNHPSNQAKISQAGAEASFNEYMKGEGDQVLLGVLGVLAMNDGKRQVHRNISVFGTASEQRIPDRAFENK